MVLYGLIQDRGLESIIRRFFQMDLALWRKTGRVARNTGKAPATDQTTDESWSMLWSRTPLLDWRIGITLLYN